MNGKSQVKTISKASASRGYLLNVAEIVLLLGLGVLAVTLHARLRYPLHLPGHHGIEFMALLIFGKKISHFKFSSTVFSIGAGMFLMLPFLGVKDPLAPIVYMLPGLFIDIVYYFIPNLKRRFIVGLIAGGLAYASIPLFRIVMMVFTGYQYKSVIVNGPIIPVIMFFGFGLVGTLFITGVLKAINSRY